MAAHQAGLQGGNDARTNIREGLRAAFDAQFRSPGQPVGWMLQAASLTASPAWKGDPPAPDGVDLAQRLLDARRTFYRNVTEQLTWLVSGVMSELGRRPRPGVDPDTVVVLVHCLLDGAVLRRFIEPDAVPSDLFADAVLLRWDALSEPGAFDDPRRPDDERGQHVFDRVVATAADLWDGRPTVTVDEVAAHASVAPRPRPCSSPPSATSPTAWSGPGWSAAASPTSDRRLLTFAGQGSAGWPSVVALMRTIGYDTD